MTAAANSPSISAADAAKELLRRRKARKSLLNFTTYTKADYEVSQHHRAVCSALDRVVKYLNDPNDPDGLSRVIICMPPQNGKSELASRRLPAYVLGRLPDTPIIATSYGDDLASSMNRDVQRIVDSPEYARLFPETRLNQKNVKTDASGSYLRNSEIFEVVGKKGYYKSAGTGGGITGRGFKLGIIDDPIKTAEEAASDTFRKKIWEWYTKVFYSRIRKGAAIVIMHTRWHEDDLIGRLLEQQKNDPNADQWHVVILPAVLDYIPDPTKEPIYYESYKLYEWRELGDPLWPSNYSLEFLRKVEAQDSEGYNALYQQRPVKPGGAMFPRTMFKLLDAITLTEHMVLGRGWDKAGTEGGGAYSSGVLLIFDPEAIYGCNFIIADVQRVQYEALAREKLIKQTAQLDHHRFGPIPIWVEEEGGSGGKESAQNTVRVTLAGHEIYAVPATGSKESRWRPFSIQVKAGNVGIVVSSWTEPYLNELSKLPAGKFKDQADASALVFNQLTIGWEQEYMIVHHQPVQISPL